MEVEKTKLDGVLLIKPGVFEDFQEYVETYNEVAYRDAGIDIKFIQDDISVSFKHVLRHPRRRGNLESSSPATTASST